MKIISIAFHGLTRKGPHDSTFKVFLPLLQEIYVWYRRQVSSAQDRCTGEFELLLDTLRFDGHHSVVVPALSCHVAISLDGKPNLYYDWHFLQRMRRHKKKHSVQHADHPTETAKERVSPYRSSLRCLPCSHFAVVARQTDLIEW